MNSYVVLISCQLTQSYAPTAKTRGSFIKMSFSVELKPAPPAFKSKVWKDFGFKVLYDTQGVRNVVKEIVICGHCFLELRYVSCRVSWHLYRDMCRVLRKGIVAALHFTEHSNFAANELSVSIYLNMPRTTENQSREVILDFRGIFLKLLRLTSVMMVQTNIFFILYFEQQNWKPKVLRKFLPQY